MSTEKAQLKIYINSSLLKKFKILCIQNDIRPSECIVDIIREWTKDKIKKDLELED